jgi:hypothetical protein
MAQSPFQNPYEGGTAAQPTARYESTRPSFGKPAAEPARVPEEALQPGTPAQLVITRGPETGAAFPINQPVTTIGRHRDCDIVLDQPTVSRYHAELHRDGHRHTIIDAGSLNGIYHNQHQVEQAELNHGDQLWIGVVHFTFHTSAPE